MKFIILLMLLFALPFVPGWLNRFQHRINKAEHQRAKVNEALAVLELSANATEEEIKAAHKRLIQKNHPDTGGSQFLASKINEARDVLLKNLNHR